MLNNLAENPDMVNSGKKDDGEIVQEVVNKISGSDGDIERVSSDDYAETRND